MGIKVPFRVPQTESPNHCVTLSPPLLIDNVKDIISMGVTVETISEGDGKVSLIYPTIAFGSNLAKIHPIPFLEHRNSHAFPFSSR